MGCWFTGRRSLGQEICLKVIFCSDLFFSSFRVIEEGRGGRVVTYKSVTTHQFYILERSMQYSLCYSNEVYSLMGFHLFLQAAVCRMMQQFFSLPLSHLINLALISYLLLILRMEY